ncbi:Hemolymph protein 14, partial [Operophtera brumata]
MVFVLLFIIATSVGADSVMEAAHCFWDDLEKQLPASRFAVAVGKVYRPWNDPMDQAQKSDVKKIYLPPYFRGAETNFQADIALVIVTNKFELNKYMMPVCLDFEFMFEIQQLRSGSRGKVAGWGLTAANGNPSPVLRVVELPFVEVGTCYINSPADFRKFITPDKICAGTLQ